MKKNKLYSIKVQILFAFSLLVLPLVSLSYFYSLSHTLFNASLTRLIEQEEVSGLIGVVERNVVDLQRNVLVFKETASQNSVDNVEHFYDQIDAGITRLAQMDTFAEHADLLDIMGGHLFEYRSNFDLVVGMRRERQAHIQRHLAFERSWISSEESLSADDIETELRLNNAILSAHNSSLSYLTSYDLKHIDNFKSDLAIALKQLQSEHITDGAKTKRSQQIEDYRENFIRVVSITRHYVYLINVVMAGSANEVLYHAENLDEIYRSRAKETREGVALSLRTQRFWSIILSVLGILIGAFVAGYFFLRITRPIEAITKVFIRLAEGQKVGDIPELSRRDEIGMLALAANVFKQKNEQTTQLLSKTRQMVDEQRDLNDALTREKLRAEQALSIKTEFLANMSHELRTPLNSIIGFTVRLLKQPTFEPRQVKALEVIERNGRHLLVMINDILDLSKIEANKLDLQIVETDLVALCRDMVSQLAPAAEDKGLRIGIATEILATVETDPARVTQILLNLISNAIKYTERGSVSVELSTTADGMAAEVQVVDTGVGISPMDQKRLFKRFEQFDDRSRFKVGQGTGLGLAIASNLAHLLGTSIHVESELGKGSRFVLTIPFVFSDPKAS